MQIKFDIYEIAKCFTHWPLCVDNHLTSRQLNLLAFQPRIDLTKWDTSFLDFTGAVPILVFGLSAHEIQIMTYVSVGENKLLRHWYKVIGVMYVLAFGLFVLVGIFGYLTFGNDVEDDFLLNCTPDSVVAFIGT